MSLSGALLQNLSYSDFKKSTVRGIVLFVQMFYKVKVLAA